MRHRQKFVLGTNALAINRSIPDNKAVLSGEPRPRLTQDRRP